VVSPGGFWKPIGHLINTDKKTILGCNFLTNWLSDIALILGTLFGRNIGLEDNDLKDLCSGILIHDVGKTRISTDILNKNGKLTKEEFAIIKTS
jgi:hypothetical protein